MRWRTATVPLLAFALACALAGCVASTGTSAGSGDTGGLPATGRPTMYYFSTDG
jgi:hypothetical protein